MPCYALLILRKSKATMFISVLDLFKIGIGPSSSHTVGPMVAAHEFVALIREHALDEASLQGASIRCTLKGSLAYTGKGHSTDRAVALGLHGYLPADLVETDVQEYHFENRGEHIMTKEKLLAIGDRFEESIAENRRQDAAYR